MVHNVSGRESADKKTQCDLPTVPCIAHSKTFLLPGCVGAVGRMTLTYGISRTNIWRKDRGRGFCEEERERGTNTIRKTRQCPNTWQMTHALFGCPLLVAPTHTKVCARVFLTSATSAKPSAVSPRPCEMTIKAD